MHPGALFPGSITGILKPLAPAPHPTQELPRTRGCKSLLWPRSRVVLSLRVSLLIAVCGQKAPLPISCPKIQDFPSLPDPTGAAASAACASQIHHPADAWKNANKSNIMIFFVNKQCSNSNLVWAVSRIHQREIDVEIFAYVLTEHLLWNAGLQ